MTREELARETAKRTGLTIKEVQIVLVTFLDIIRETLAKGDNVFLRSFGCFSTKKGRERRIRDPRNDGIMVVPARFRVSFKPYPVLRDSVQKSLAPMAREAFFCIGYPRAEKVSVVGNFNSWSRTSTPMEPLPDGSWFTEISIPSGQNIQYHFLVDGVKKFDPQYKSDVNGNSIRQV